MKPETTKVIFRQFNGDNSIIALFPEIPADFCEGYCLSYQRIGQHGAASLGIAPMAKLAKPSEYAELKKELESIGYVLQIVTKATRKMQEVRRSKMSR